MSMMTGSSGAAGAPGRRIAGQRSARNLP